MKTLTERIQRKIEILTGQIEAADAKMKENYIYNFQWGYPEELYKRHLKKNSLAGFLAFVTENPGRAGEWLEHNIKQITTELLSGKYSENSTSQFSNMAFIFEKEVKAELLTEYKEFIEFISE